MLSAMYSDDKSALVPRDPLAVDNDAINSVDYILRKRPFSLQEKIAIKRLGRPVPMLTIKKCTIAKGKEYRRCFKTENTYDRFLWMCGCWERNKLYCFVCLLSDKTEPSPWTRDGVDNLQHINDRSVKHEMSVIHIHNSIDFSMLGEADIYKQLNSAYFYSIQPHNEKVDNNRQILRRLIMCIKFCGAFELALRGGDESGDSLNTGVFRGIVDFAAELDLASSVHFKQSSVLKDTSKTILINELLDAMSQVCKEEIRKQIIQSNYLAIEADETTDAYNQQQLVIILRYVFKGQIFERFWKFIRPEDNTAEVIAKALMEELDGLDIPVDRLISQSYDGGAVMSGRLSGVQSIIRRKYEKASYVHSYAHEFNLILEKAASCNRKLKRFFSDIQSFSSFFSRPTKRASFLDEIVNRRLQQPGAAKATWNFKTKTIDSLFEKKSLIREYLEKIIDFEEDSKTVSEASALLRNLDCEDFNYFLEVMHCLTPHIEVFFKKVQSPNADSSSIQEGLKKLEFEILEIKEKKIEDLQVFEEDDTEPSSSKRFKWTNKTSEINRIVAKEFCDEIISLVRDRFDFTEYLYASKLFASKLYHAYAGHFPVNIFDEAVKFYSFLDKDKLKKELTVVYQREDMRSEGIVPLLRFFYRNDLKNTLSETSKLVEILCTMPINTKESERCFSTLKKIKSFLRSIVSQDRLNAVAMLSLEKQLVQSIADFDNKVIDIFVSKPERQMEFCYK